jgi:hypothetical protein
LVSFYETVDIPALALGEFDRARGVMTDDRRGRVAESAITLVDNLENYAEEEAAANDEDESDLSQDKPADDTAEDAPTELPDGTGKTVPYAGGRGELDNARSDA